MTGNHQALGLSAVIFSKGNQDKMIACHLNPRLKKIYKDEHVGNRCLKIIK